MVMGFLPLEERNGIVNARPGDFVITGCCVGLPP
jgi:hypothetical protein